MTPEPADDARPALRAFAHPLRLRILSLLTGAPLSAADVARELDTTQANASYHLRRLHEAGLLRVAEEVKVRGGVAKRYEHDPASGERIRSEGPDDDLLLAAALGEELRRRTAQRVPGGTNVLTDAELWVADETWERATALVREAMRLLHDRALPPHAEGTVRTSTTVSMFRMGDEPQGER